MKKLPLAVALLGVVITIGLQFYPPEQVYFRAKPVQTEPDLPKHTDRDGWQHASPYDPSVVFESSIKPNPVVPIMQIVISMIVLASGLWVVLSGKYQTTEKHWAYGAIGTIIGFWFKG
jgi:hypothetical protein